MYATVARHHIIGSQLGATPMHRVRPSAVDGWPAELRRKGLSDSTRRSAYTILRAIFDAAVMDRELADNPVVAIGRPRGEVKGAAYLTPEQVKSLLEAADGTRYGLLFELLVNTGPRRGEALALKWRSHVKEDDGWLKIRGTLTREDGELVVTSTKTAKCRREVPITDHRSHGRHPPGAACASGRRT